MLTFTVLKIHSDIDANDDPPVDQTVFWCGQATRSSGKWRRPTANGPIGFECWVSCLFIPTSFIGGTIR